MPLEAELLTSLALAIAVVYWSTPLAIRLADRYEFYDRPVGYKGHAQPTPYLGGLAVVGGYVFVLLLLTADWGRTLPLLAGVAALWVVGTVDDRRTVSPSLRVGIELALAAGLFALGLGWDLGAGPLVDLAVTAVWVVAVVNAFNLFDNMDGATSSMAGVVAAGLAVLGAIQGDAWLAVAAAALSGACWGFLPHNLLRTPARIFLGDGGSMPIGFAVAALTMIGMSGAAAEWQSLAMGVLFVGVPALDMALVVVSRRRRGISLMTGGRDHLTHRTRQRVRTARAVAVALGSAQAVVSVLALVAIERGSFAVVIAVAAYLVAVGAAITVLDARYENAVAPDGLPTRSRGSSFEAAAPAVLVPLAAIAGLSPFAFGYYHSDLWVPAGLVLVLLVTACAIARPVQLSGPAWVALGGLTGLALLSLLSGLWADSVQQAVVEANRLLVYAVLLGGLFLVVRSDRSALWLLGAFAVTGLVVAGTVVVRMLGADSPGLFLAGRLNDPMGYINGQASFYLLALWPCLAAAEQRRSALVAAAGAAASALLACLLLLSQSRGVALAALVTTTAVLLLVPGRVRRAWALVVVGSAIAPAVPVLLEVFETQASAEAVHRAAVATLASALGAGLLWGSLVATVQRTGPSPWFRPLGGAGLALLCAAGLFVSAVNAGRIADTVSEQYRVFVLSPIEPQGDLVDQTGRSRLLTGAGNRYDYWRVAWSSFREHPVRGVGAGGFDSEWFAKRRTTEDVRQPHSIELQVLAELGLLGFALLAALMGAVGWGAWRTARAGAASPAAAAVAVAGIGMVVAWLVHTSVDWIHLLPGVTAGGLAGAVALLRGRSGAGPREPAALSVGPGRALAASVAIALVIATAGLSLVRQALSEHYSASAQAAMPARPIEAIRQADRSLRLDPEALPAYYVKAAAFARLGDATGARITLEEATRREPRDFVTWALLGDLAVRTGDEEAARRNYARAARLNPKDPALQAEILRLAR